MAPARECSESHASAASPHCELSVLHSSRIKQVRRPGHSWPWSYLMLSWRRHPQTFTHVGYITFCIIPQLNELSALRTRHTRRVASSLLLSSFRQCKRNSVGCRPKKANRNAVLVPSTDGQTKIERYAQRCTNLGMYIYITYIYIYTYINIVMFCYDMLCVEPNLCKIRWAMKSEMYFELYAPLRYSKYVPAGKISPTSVHASQSVLQEVEVCHHK